MLTMIPLGSSGWIPTDKRNTSCFLCQTDQHLILLDAGTGLHKLRDYQHILDRYEEIHIILSHYHLDHIIGLSYLPRYLAGKTLHLYGPGAPYYPDGCKEILCRFTAPPFFAQTIDQFAPKAMFHNYDENGFAIGDLTIAITPQQHSHPSFGITLGSYLHYATDTNAKAASFEKNVSLLLHECWAERKEDAKEHSSLEEIQLLAAHSKIPAIGLVHLNPIFSEKQLNTLTKNPIFIVEEGMELHLQNVLIS